MNSISSSRPSYSVLGKLKYLYVSWWLAIDFYVSHQKSISSTIIETIIWETMENNPMFMIIKKKWKYKTASCCYRISSTVTMFYILHVFRNDFFSRFTKMLWKYCCHYSDMKGPTKKKSNWNYPLKIIQNLNPHVIKNRLQKRI